MKIHIVQKGDTLWKIAQKYNASFEQLKSMNTQLSDPDMLMPGMKIKVPTGSVQVKKHPKEAPINKKPLKMTAPAPPPLPYGGKKPAYMESPSDSFAPIPDANIPLPNMGMNVAPMNVAPMNVAPMNAPPMNVAPMNVAPKNVAPMNAPPMNVAPMMHPPFPAPCGCKPVAPPCPPMTAWMPEYGYPQYMPVSDESPEESSSVLPYMNQQNMPVAGMYHQPMHHPHHMPMHHPHHMPMHHPHHMPMHGYPPMGPGVMGEMANAPWGNVNPAFNYQAPNPMPAYGYPRPPGSYRYQAPPFQGDGGLPDNAYSHDSGFERKEESNNESS